MAEQTNSGGMKLTLIQNEMKAPKTEYNKFGGFKYRTTGEIQYFLKPLCAKYHTQVVPSSECVWLGSDARGAFFQKATVSMLDADTGELIAESTAMAREDDDKKGMSAPQLSASAAQFAVKRALEQLLMLDDSAPEVDAMSPTDMAQQAPQPQRRVPQPRQAQPVQQPRAQAQRAASLTPRQAQTASTPQKPAPRVQAPAQPVQAPARPAPEQPKTTAQAPKQAGPAAQPAAATHGPRP